MEWVCCKKFFVQKTFQNERGDFYLSLCLKGECECYKIT